MEILSYIAVGSILITYALLNKNPRLFDIANLIGNIPLVIVAYQKAAYASMAISLSFGFIALYRVWEWLWKSY